MQTQQPQTIGEIIKTSLPQIIETSKTEHSQNKAYERPMTIEELSVFLSKPVASIYQMTSKRKIPFTRCGRDLLFFPSEIIEWLKTNRVKTQEQMAQEVSENLCHS
jgi:excisionase family DNA binding protein